jgi:hypothetical protein
MINLETARRVIATAEKKAVEIKQPMNIAIAAGRIAIPGASRRCLPTPGYILQADDPTRGTHTPESWCCYWQAHAKPTRTLIAA